MANTKIRNATAVVTPAGTDEYATAQGSASKKTTLAQVKTFVTTDPDFAAGSASAGTWPNLASGTLLTTAAAGAIERDANNFYLTTDAGNRGIVDVVHFVRADVARTLPNNTSENAIFDSPTNGRLTLETGTYTFKSFIAITAMSATSGNALFDWLGAGTAVAGTWLWVAYGYDNTVAGEAASRAAVRITQDSAASIYMASANTAMSVDANGTFEVTTGGTLIPSIALVTAIATASVAAGSYFMCQRIGSTSVVSVGQWD
jgi:hypothetical protein